jgi:hypothetical protein
MIRLAEPLAWEVDLEPGCAGRQLRLVPDEITVSGQAVTVGATEPAAHPEADLEAVQTLASYVVRLRPGSQCCWCGDILVQSEVETGPYLVCRSCGALVDSPMSVQSGGVRL